MALAALEHYDLIVKRVRLISTDWNGIFRVDTAEGDRYILRVCMPEPHGFSIAAIRSEMMWLAALRRDTDLSVPQPLATREGDLVITAEAAGVPEPRHCVVFSWVPGVNLADRLTLENMAKLGELSAQLHNHADTFTPPEGFVVNRYDKVFYYQEPVLIFDDAYRALFPPDRRRVFERAVERVEEALGKLATSGDGMRVIHGDLHQWNAKVFRGKLSAIDFEELMWGYPVQDIAITFYYLQGHDFPTLREAFTSSYTRHRAWPEQYPGEMDTFMAGRALTLVNTIIQDPSPEYRQQAPHFIERKQADLQAFLDGNWPCAMGQG